MYAKCEVLSLSFLKKTLFYFHELKMSDTKSQPLSGVLGAHKQRANAKCSFLFDVHRGD